MICPKCGYDVGEHKFCPECGEKIEAEPLTNENSDKNENNGVQEATNKVDSKEPVGENKSSSTEQSPADEADLSKDTVENKQAEKSNKIKPFLEKALKYKKFIIIFVVIVIAIASLILITHKSDDVKACIAYIDAVTSNVTIYSDNSIALAEKIYDNLSKSDKRKVNNYDDLVEARKTCDNLIADSVELEIDKLSNNSELYQIQNVRSKFDNLTENQKSYVENLSTLQKYEESYYNDMIDEAIKAIDNITYVSGSATTDDEEAINAAQEAYDKIDDNYKNKVTNYSKLENATKNLSAFYLESAQTLIDESIKNDKGYSKAEDAYNKLTDDQKKQIKNYDEFTNKYDEYKNKSPIKLISYRLGSNSINNPEFYLTAKNVGDSIIKSFSVSMFAYDDDGVPISLGYNDYIRNLNYDESLKVGATTPSNIYWTFYGMYDKSSIKKVVVIVKEVNYFDGSTWTNPNYGTLCDKYEQQIISANDSNILSKG